MVLRFGVACLGLIGVAWAWYAWRTAPVPARLGEIAARTLVGETYEPDVLIASVRSAEDRLGPRCDVGIRRDILVIRARIADMSLERGDIGRLDGDLADLDRAAGALLACSPRESFGWFVRYRVAVQKGGISADALPFLLRSYRYGPREAWIAVRRNRMALATFSQLPPDLKLRALREFRELIASRLEPFAADTFVVAAPDVQTALLSAVSDMSETEKYSFYVALRVRRVDVESLGVDVRPDRPWWKY